MYSNSFKLFGASANSKDDKCNRSSYEALPRIHYTSDSGCWFWVILNSAGTPSIQDITTVLLEPQPNGTGVYPIYPDTSSGSIVFDLPLAYQSYKGILEVSLKNNGRSFKQTKTDSKS